MPPFAASERQMGFLDAGRGTARQIRYFMAGQPNPPYRIPPPKK